MGSSPSGKLMYGYNLMGTDGEFSIKNVTADGVPDVPWWSSDDDNEDDDDIAGVMHNILLAAIGFDENDWRVPGFWERKRAAETQLGLKLEYNGSHDFSGTLLVAWSVSVGWGEVLAIDWELLDQQRQREDWDKRLGWGVKTLGLVPLQTRPQWLLATFYG